MKTETPPVVIAGAGPAGLAAALSLGQLGIETLLVERRSELSSQPRAPVVSLRSMELVRSWGVEDTVRAFEMDVESRGWSSGTLAGVADGAGWPLGMPTRAQAAVLSPTSPAWVPQDQLEPILLDRLRSLDAGRVRLNTEVVGVNHAGDGVEVVLRDRAGGALQTVRTRYLIAADGAHSRIRAMLGIAMRGPDGLAHVANA